MEATAKVPIYRKYGLTIEESANYFGIGTNTLRRFVKEHSTEDFLLTVGNKTLIKRVKFEELLDGISSM